MNGCGWGPIKLYLWMLTGFPDDSGGKESACSAGYLGSIPGSRRSPGEGNGYPLHGQRSLVGYNPWGHKELARLSD